MEENLIKRIQPQSTEAEQTVIGSMILDNECIPNMQNLISGRDFYNRQYGVLFDAITELYGEGKAVDVLTLQNRMKEKDVSPELASMEYMGELIASVPISANAKYYAEIVYEKALLRRLIHAAEDVANECYAGKDKLDKILEDAESSMFKVLNERKTTEFVPIFEITMNALEKINEASKTRNPITGLATGFADLDRMTTGLHGSDYVLIAARPSMGKTALALNIVQNVVFRDGRSAAYFSLEMSKEVLMNRLFAQESRVDAQSIRTGNLSDEDWDKLMESANTIGRSQLIIDDTPGISVSELRSKCRKFKLEHGLDLVVIDYLQLMSGTGRGNENRQQEISDISRGLKALARELDAPIIALSQLSRAPEARNDKRPMMSDLRESGAIEQDADVVMFLYRDEYYNKDTDAKGITELILGKQRNGPVGTVKLAWLPQYVKFANLSKDSIRE